MIKKWYEVSCDNCGVAINHYPDYKPDIKLLREHCGLVKRHNGKIITICKDCYDRMCSEVSNN